MANYPSFTHDLVNFALTEKGSHDRYVWYKMSKNVSLHEIIPKDLIYTDLKTDVKIKASVRNSINSTIQTAENSIPLRIKESFYNGTEYKVILCGKAYYLSEKNGKDFQFWVELAKLQAYEKIVIFNNSIENTETFRQVFTTHKDFIQVMQYQCLPNYYRLEKAGSPKFIDFNYMKTQLKWDPLHHHMFFERMTQNECYWENRDKYRNIAVLDNDESVIPRILEKHYENGYSNLMGQLGQKNDGIFSTKEIDY